MAAFIAMIVYMVLLPTPNIFAAKDEEWKSATATYTKEIDGSIIAGTLFLHHKTHKIVKCLNMVFYNRLVLKICKETFEFLQILKIKISFEKLKFWFS